MKEEEELVIRNRLLAEEARRNRRKFVYTNDALPHLMTWPESHDDVRGVISGEIDYNSISQRFRGVRGEVSFAASMLHQSKISDFFEEEEICLG